jgi:hypothetical protein
MSFIYINYVATSVMRTSSSTCVLGLSDRSDIRFEKDIIVSSKTDIFPYSSGKVYVF